MERRWGRGFLKAFVHLSQEAIMGYDHKGNVFYEWMTIRFEQLSGTNRTIVSVKNRWQGTINPWVNTFNGVYTTCYDNKGSGQKETDIMDMR